MSGLPKLKIALVEVAVASANVFSRAYLPRVGIATLGAILKKSGYACDLYYRHLAASEIEKFEQYDIVGISSLSNTVSDAYRIADALKQKKPTVIMGGPHVTFMSEEALEHCDYVVIGEGDATLPALVDAIEKSSPPDKIPGLAFHGPDGKMQSTGKPELVDYSNIPSPDFSLAQEFGEKPPPIVVTSRGCPHDCAFCAVTYVFGKKYRFKSNEKIIEELRPIRHRSVCFGDDNFCANPMRAKKFLRELIEKDAGPLRWSSQMTVGALADTELLELMQKTHCRIVYVGIESVNPDTLAKYGKAHKVDAIKKGIDNAHKHHVGIHGMFVVDPDEGVETPERIVDYAIANDIDTIQIFPLIPFPGTVVYEKNKQDLLHMDWRYFDGMHVVTRPKNCSPYNLQMSIINAMKRFYSLKRVLTAYRPHRGWRVKYRLGGYILVRKWVKENAEYLERLKSYS